MGVIASTSQASWGKWMAFTVMHAPAGIGPQWIWASFLCLVSSFFQLHSSRHSWRFVLICFCLSSYSYAFLPGPRSQELFSFHVCGLYGTGLLSLLLFPSVMISWGRLPSLPSPILFIEVCYFICRFPLNTFHNVQAISWPIILLC